jgi:hypothetical protein
MKKWITFLTIVLPFYFVMGGQAQVLQRHDQVNPPMFFADSDLCTISTFPYSEGFEYPITTDCWRIYDIDGDGSIWELVSDRAHSGSFSAKHRWTSRIYGNQVGWLISPKIIVPAGKIINLSFWSSNEDPNSYGMNSVWISENDFDPQSGQYVKVWSPESVSEDWVETEISLASYMGKEIYIAFRYDGLYAHSWYIDDLNFTEFQGTDTGVTAITAPVNGHLTDAESITIKVKNFGTETINNVPVEVQIDNELPVSGIVPSIAFGEEVEYTFPETVNLSAEKTYTIKSYTKFDTDINPTNDTTAVKVTNTGICAVSKFPYIESFEDDIKLLCWDKFYYDTDGETNGWKAVTTTTAHGGTHSIYHIFGSTSNQDGWLVSPEIQIPAGGVYLLTFWSYNPRPTWYGKNSVWISKNSNDPASEDFVEIWTTNSVVEDWVETKINLADFIGENIHIAFRYEGNNAHSWYLDDLKIELLTGADAGVTAITSPTSGSNLTATETITLKVKNFGAEALTNVPVKITVNDGIPIGETVPSIGLNQEVEYTFTLNKLDLSAVKTYTIKGYTEYPDDIDLSNDAKTISVTNDGNVAVMGNSTSITSCNIPFVDDGKNGNYSESANETQTVTFYPETPGDKVTAEFTTFSSTPYNLFYYLGLLSETLGDTLYVYNGNTVDENLLIGSLTGDLSENLPLPFRSSAPDGSLTFVFKKQSNMAAAGWEANIACFTPHSYDATISKILSPLKDGASPAQVSVLISNYGDNPIASSFDVAYTLNDGLPVVETCTGNIAPNATTEFTFVQGADISEYKDYTLKVYTLLANDADLTNDTASISFTHKENVTLYGYRIYDEAFPGVNTDMRSVVAFDTWDPSVITIPSTYQDGDNITYSGECAGDTVYIYTRANNTGSPVNFIKLTNNWTEISSVAITNTPNDMAYDYSTKTLYGISYDNDQRTMVLQTVDLETGELTPVVNISNVNNYLYTLAADLKGNLYGIDYNGNLVSINKETGVGALIGNTGVDPLYAQSMAFDHNTERLFWAMHNTKSKGNLLELDPVTGAVSDLGIIGGNAQIVALYTIYNPGNKDGITELNVPVFTIFPNPAKDAVYVSSVPDNSTILILDLTGRIIESRRIATGGNNVKLDLNLGSGIYFVQIKNNKTKVTQKLMIK